MTQADRHRIKAARQRLVLCRLMIDLMRNLHGSYAPASEPFGNRLETFFIGLCVAVGQFDGRPFSVAKIEIAVLKVKIAVADATTMNAKQHLGSGGHGR